MTTYTGIIDNHGLESFRDSKKNTFPFKIRAALNQHRNARVYFVTMSETMGKRFDMKIRTERNWKKHAKQLQRMKTFKWDADTLN